MFLRLETRHSLFELVACERKIKSKHQIGLFEDPKATHIERGNNKTCI
jgi:hypothetical protein